MSILYIDKSDCVIGKQDNRITVKYKDGMIRTIPVESIDGIILLGHAQVTTQCIQECLKKGISLSYFSKGGHYFGRLSSTGHIKASLQRKQAGLYDQPFALELSKKIIYAKIHNQIVVLRRYSKSTNHNISDIELHMKSALRKVNHVKSIEELMGYEGSAAKYYFKGLSICIDDAFKFEGRSKRPPRDAFNSMLSLGYSILINELYGEIEIKGLNAYFGFLHRDAEKYPTLASDMMEEWRAVLIDSTVMSMINGHEVYIDEFYSDDGEGVYISKQALNKFIKKLENKFQICQKYLDYIDYPVSFRSAISFQMSSLVDAIVHEDVSMYSPIMIR